VVQKSISWSLKGTRPLFTEKLMTIFTRPSTSMPSSVYEKTLGAYCSANPNDDTLDEKYDCRILQDVLPGEGQ
jgi:hypothetical protein